MIHLEDVHLNLAGKDVLKGLELRFRPGDRMVIMGESGIGKSTILRVILGLWRPDRGRVLWNGEDIHQFAENELVERRRQLAIVFQGGALFDSLTVGENVGYRLFEEGRLSPQEIEKKVRGLLAAVDLEEAIDDYPVQLSGGMRKRAALARALAGDPHCILFDEPTAGLDPVGSCRVNRLIRRCQEQGTGTLVVTHDLDCAFQVGKTFVLIYDGRVVFSGSRAEMESSQQPDLRRFLAPMENACTAEGQDA